MTWLSLLENVVWQELIFAVLLQFISKIGRQPKRKQNFLSQLILGSRWSPPISNVIDLVTKTTFLGLLSLKIHARLVEVWMIPYCCLVLESQGHPEEHGVHRRPACHDEVSIPSKWNCCGFLWSPQVTVLRICKVMLRKYCISKFTCSQSWTLNMLFWAWVYFLYCIIGGTWWTSAVSNVFRACIKE